MIKCRYGECKNFKAGRCKKQEALARLSTEEIARMMITNICHLREDKKEK